MAQEAEESVQQREQRLKRHTKLEHLSVYSKKSARELVITIFALMACLGIAIAILLDDITTDPKIWIIAAFIWLCVTVAMAATIVGVYAYIQEICEKFLSLQ